MGLISSDCSLAFFFRLRKNDFAYLALLQTRIYFHEERKEKRNNFFVTRFFFHFKSVLFKITIFHFESDSITFQKFICFLKRQQKKTKQNKTCVLLRSPFQKTIFLAIFSFSGQFAPKPKTCSRVYS